MKSKWWIGAFALIAAAATTAVKADIVDQTRIRVASPVSPSLDPNVWPSSAELDRRD